MLSFITLVVFATLALGSPAPTPTTRDIPTSAEDVTAALISPSTWNPPSNLTTALTQVWDHEMSTYNNGNALGFTNYGYDILVANSGKLNYCVRWESNVTLTATDRTNIQNALQRSIGKWMEWLYGFDGFPYSSVPVTVTGWAVYNTSLMSGVTSETIYTNKDSSGAPECAEACGRFFHQDNNYSGCSGGSAKHYDMSLWLTEGFSGGAGGDWGQRVGREYAMQNINLDSMHIILHEMGHTFALDDFYDWTPTGVTNFIMLAGSSTVITNFDGWMLRDWWRHLKTRYNISSSSSSSTSTSTTTTTTTSSGGSGCTVAKWGQCGGQSYTGCTTCASGSTCTYSNAYYSQCL
ncbi:hypothetical protein BKA62DRAFT_765578 [Auriculariales sp. MPI-PUGE-AT-0066]|nr:hypothetical protein BKA62DRAFT_765578 [Auriculariales sp. MPI-PUGE-AT-0066]